MTLPAIKAEPSQNSYDVVIIGGATMGSAVAWFLSANADFNGSVLVVERDNMLEQTSTEASNNCMRQQFATEINVKIGQYAAEYVKDFRANLGGDPEVPHLAIQNFGYLYLSDNKELSEALIRDQKTQAACGSATRILTADKIAAAYSFYNLDDIELGSLNTVDEGYYNAPALVKWWRRKARENGVEYLQNEAVSIGRDGDRVDSVTLKSGATIAAGMVINAAGPRARLVAEMAGLSIPVEPRRRYTYIFEAERPLDQDLPLTIDPTGVHFRTYGKHYLVGCPPLHGDPAVDFDEFGYEPGIWEEKLQPVLANRIPAFSDIRVLESWVGHYEFNTFDRNAIVGPHSTVENYLFVNGFSGHGSQQAPAMGRGLSELITYGEFRELDLGAFAYDRIERNEPLVERAVI